MAFLGLKSRPCTCAAVEGAVEAEAAVADFEVAGVGVDRTGPRAYRAGGLLGLGEVLVGAAAVVVAGAAEEANSDLVVASGPSLAGVGGLEEDLAAAEVVASVAEVRFGHAEKLGCGHRTRVVRHLLDV